MKTNITINAIEKTITVSKSFYKRASAYGTTEYNELRSAMIENPTFEIVFKTIEKKTYGGLDFKQMEAYIRTQDNSKANLAKFEAVKRVAEAKGSKYPLTKKWFLATFPAYKENTVCDAETSALLDHEREKNNNPTDTVKPAA